MFCPNLSHPCVHCLQLWNLPHCPCGREMQLMTKTLEIDWSDGTITDDIKTDGKLEQLLNILAKRCFRCFKSLDTKITRTMVTDCDKNTKHVVDNCNYYECVNNSNSDDVDVNLISNSYRNCFIHDKKTFQDYLLCAGINPCELTVEDDDNETGKVKTRIDYAMYTNILKLFSKNISFRLCIECGDKVTFEYNTMVTAHLEYDSKNVPNIIDSAVEQSIDGRKVRFSDRKCTHSRGNDYYNNISYRRRYRDYEAIRYREKNVGLLTSNARKFDFTLDYHKQLHQVEAMYYNWDCDNNDNNNNNKDKGIRVLASGNNADYNHINCGCDCICGSETMTARVHNKGIFAVCPGNGVRLFVDERILFAFCEYTPKRLVCNICKFVIQFWEPYYTCEYGSIMNEESHEYGFRICKLCAVIRKADKYKSYNFKCTHNESQRNQQAQSIVIVNDDDDCIRKSKSKFSINIDRLNDDLLLTIFDYAVTSYISMIQFQHVCTTFHFILNKKVFIKRKNINITRGHDTDDDEREDETSLQKQEKNREDPLSIAIAATIYAKKGSKLKQRTTTPHPTVSNIWKRLVLLRWPGFMTQDMIDVYSKKIDQRWDLFFQVRFMTVKQKMKQDKMSKLLQECPYDRDHVLKQIIVKKRHWYKCDSCEVIQAKGNIIFSCRECDFDLCEYCFKNDEFTNRNMKNKS